MIAFKLTTERLDPHTGRYSKGAKVVHAAGVLRCHKIRQCEARLAFWLFGLLAQRMESGQNSCPALVRIDFDIVTLTVCGEKPIGPVGREPSSIDNRAKQLQRI